MKRRYLALGAIFLLPMWGCGGATATGGGSGGGSSSTSTTSSGSGNGESCPTDIFLDVSKAPGPGAAYPTPYLNVSCTDTHLVVETNGLPHYTFVPMTPNALVEAEHTYQIPRYPEVAAEPSDVPFLGYIGVVVNGTSIFGPNEGQTPDLYGDPIYNDIMDGCQGHTAFEYHHHALAQKCLVDSGLVAEPWMNPDPDPSEPSPILAYAADGFPIYGPYGCLDEACAQVVEFQSSWQVKDGQTPENYAWDPSDNAGAANAYTNTGAYEYVEREGETYLDKCNGRTGPDGRYRYHATSAFPYTIACYRGTPEGIGNGGGQRGGNGGGMGGGMGPPDCQPGQTSMCCGDGKCNGPETPQNCPEDCP